MIEYKIWKILFPGFVDVDGLINLKYNFSLMHIHLDCITINHHH